MPSLCGILVSMMADWMMCTSCRKVAVVNETGICLSCQRGFTGIPQEDSYVFKEKIKLEEKIYATQERIKKIDNREEY